MREHVARELLLVRAVERADADSLIVPRSLRVRASREALSEAPLPPEDRSTSAGEKLNQTQKDYLASRTSFLLKHLEDSAPEMSDALSRTRWPGWLGPGIMFVALVSGLMSNAMGPDQRVNILAFPMMGMIVWNLGVYALLLWRRFMAKDKVRGRFVIQTLSRFVFRRTDHAAQSGDRGLVLQRGIAAFVNQWLQFGKPLHLARITTLLHIGAAMLALGAVAGMYWRGVGFQYQAGWESTFLNEHTVRSILQVVLGPASLITGIALPSAEELAAMRWPQNEGAGAAMWIHLYAATVALFVVIPRFALANAEKTKILTNYLNFPLPDQDDPYFHRLLTVREGTGDHVRVVPCGFSLSGQETIQGALAELMGLSVQMEFADQVPYGEEDAFLERCRSADVCECLILIFNLSTTPEKETHGRLIERTGDLVAAGQAGRKLLVLVEESGYRGRLQGQAGWEDRLEQRRDGWRRLVTAAGQSMASIDLERNLDNWAAENRHLVEKGDEG